MTDYYQVLGLPRDCTEDMIKTAFRNQAKLSHPDLNPNDPEAEGRFKQINEAYEVLKDPQRRAQYDGQRTGTFNHEFRFNSFDDVFNAFRAQHRQRNEDITVSYAISLEDAFNGRDISFELTINGKKRRVDVSIPKGVEFGHRIRVPGQGGTMFESLPPGDLYLMVSLHPHPIFNRTGPNLIVTKSIDAFDAMLGSSIIVATIDGTDIEVTVPPGTQNQQVLRIAGRGMPFQGVDRRGDLLVVMDVTVPSELTEEQIGLLKQARELRS